MQLATRVLITAWLVTVAAYELARFVWLEKRAEGSLNSELVHTLNRLADRQACQVAAHVGAASLLVLFLWLFL